MSTVPLSRYCADDLHGFCTGDASTCGCPDCHFICASCGQPCRTLNGPDRNMCAGCARALARTQQRIQTCDRCGHVGAVRDPRDRRNLYLCHDCRGGNVPQLPGVAVDLNAPCAGLDADNLAHDFWQVKGRKHVCRRCTMVWYAGKGYRKIYS